MPADDPSHSEVQDALAERGRSRNFQHEVWRNMYFYMVNNPGHDKHGVPWNDVKMCMFSDWKVAEHMGRSDMSKSLRPCVFGETKANPRRTYLLLRGWMLWRARRDGWANGRPSRRREFDYDEMQLENEIRALRADSAAGAAGSLLGHAGADALLRTWVPELCARLEAS